MAQLAPLSTYKATLSAHTCQLSSAVRHERFFMSSEAQRNLNTSVIQGKLSFLFLPPPSLSSIEIQQTTDVLFSRARATFLGHGPRYGRRH